MHWTYSCPHCAATLNPDRNIVLRAEREDRRILVGFHPQPGNYEVYLPPGVEVEPGSRWRFRCPVCHADLTADADSDLCALVLHAAGRRTRVLFSRVAGHQATFVVGEEQVEEHHGRDADLYRTALANLKYLV